MLERDFQRKVLSYLERKGCYIARVILSNKRGVPDILGCYKGKFFAIELKKDRRSNISKMQIKNSKEILQADGQWLLLYYSHVWGQEVNDFLNRMDE